MGCQTSCLVGAGDGTQDLAHGRQTLLPLNHIPQALSIDLSLSFLFFLSFRKETSTLSMTSAGCMWTQVRSTLPWYSISPTQKSERGTLPHHWSPLVIAGNILEHLTTAKISFDYLVMGRIPCGFMEVNRIPSGWNRVLLESRVSVNHLWATKLLIKNLPNFFSCLPTEPEALMNYVWFVDLLSRPALSQIPTLPLPRSSV